MEQDRYTYYAFISYKREDEKWAKWLQRKLESYGFPVALRRENASLPTKIRPIFRDQSELSGGNLKKEIEKGLSGSRYLIVICSPRAAKSPWVSKEVQYFIDNGREEFIVPFIIGGTPNAANPEDECFPEGLRLLSGEKEILGININEMGRDAAAIKVIARMFGLRFDTLWQRHERAKRRRRLAVVAGVILFALISFGVGAYMAYLNTQIRAQRDRAEAQTKIANKERNRANRERDRANTERDNALRANRDLALAKDSILLQANLIVKTNKDLEKSNRNLGIANNNLAIEKENVTRALINVRSEQIKLKSQNIRKYLDNGKILLATKEILPLIPDGPTDTIPYVEVALDVLNNCYAQLSARGYKIIDILPTDTLFNNEGRWCAYNDEGIYYLYDTHTQQSYQLPGEDVVDRNAIYFDADDNLYGIGCTRFYQWDISSMKLRNELDISADFTAWLNGDKETYNPFASDVIPAFNPISYFSDKPDRNWGNYTINHFDSLDEDGLYKLFVTHNNKSMGYIAFDPKYKLNRDFNYSRTLPVIAYRESDYCIKVLDLPNKQSYKIFQSWKSEDSLINKIAVFNTGSEIAINGKLFSRRAFSPLQAAILHVYRDSTSMSHEYKFNKNIDKKRIRYNGQSWSLLDSKYNRNLYIEDGNGSGFEKLLIENDGQFQSFAPFIGFTMGNGIGMMFSARIISKDEILIIAAQGQHFVYNTKTGNRLYFSSSNLNTFDSDYCHAQMFTSGADLVNQDRWLVTVSGGGVITIHDIQTGCLLMECTIQAPGEYAASNFTSSIYFTPSHFSEDGKYIYGQLSVDDDKKYIGYQIPTLTDFIKQARKEFAKFWND